MDFPGEKLVIKLWETIADKGVGSLLMPWQIRREGRARNQVRHDELAMLAQAEVDVADIRAGRKRIEARGSPRIVAVEDSLTVRNEARIALPSLAEAAVATDIAEAARNEVNTSKAVIYAEELLAGDPQLPPDRAVDDDWLFTWREYASKVSTEDLQRLWGGVLAGEVKSPGSYSLRTLQFLRSLSRDEAELITRLSGCVIEGRIVKDEKPQLVDRGVTDMLLVELEDLGVVSGATSIGLTSSHHSAYPDRFLTTLRSNGKVLVVQHEDPAKVLQLNVCLLTSIGAQILGLGSFQPDLEYLRFMGKYIAAKGYSVQLGDWTPAPDGSGNCSNLEPIVL